MLTDEQAIAYCESRDTPSGGQIYNAQITEWRQIANSIRRDGLEETISSITAFIQQAQANTDPRRSYNTTVYQSFLDALTNPEVKETFLADELIESLKKEDPGSPLQQAIRAEVIKMIQRVSDGDESFNQALINMEDLKEEIGDIIERYGEMVEAKQSEADEDE